MTFAMMKLISKFAGAFGLVLTSVAPITAMDIKAEPVAVLELFTSQGCSSCPPADEILSELSHDKNFITLAYHVDYWNYIAGKILSVRRRIRTCSANMPGLRVKSVSIRRN